MLSAEAEEISERDLVVRNVTIEGQAGYTGDVVVNIVIRDGKLDLLTKDKLHERDAGLVLDADGGFILGKLEIGQAANFVVMSSDPRENVDVILDSRDYATFAIREGLVVLNLLTPVMAEEVDEAQSHGKSREYLPPATALPLTYGNTEKWNSYESRWFSGSIISILFMDRIQWLTEDSGSKILNGDLSSFDGGKIRGFRFGTVGTINFENPWFYTFWLSSNAFDKGFETEQLNDYVPLDWRLEIPFFKHSMLSIGKQKEHVSGERLQSMMFNQMQERSSASDGLMPSRNVGAVWYGNSPQKYSSWAVGVFNDWFVEKEDFNESDSVFLGRLTWAPLRSEDDSNLLHLGVSFRYSNVKEGVRYVTQPEFDKSPDFVDTAFGQEMERFPGDRSETWNVEASWRRRSFWLASEVTQTKVVSPDYGNPSFSGYWVAASWILTGEMRPYNKRNGTFGSIPISRPVPLGGRGSWELAARWSNLDLNDGRIEGGEIDIFSLGVTWWLSDIFGMNANYRYIWNERNGLLGESSAINLRLMMVLL